MTPDLIALSSLAMDLRRVAIGSYRGSQKMAERFLEEAKKRVKEIPKETVKPYIAKILDKISTFPSSDLNKSSAEDMLLYSILLQNSVTKRMNLL